MFKHQYFHSVFRGWLNSRQAVIYFCILVPLTFAVISIALGQDDNCDLQNYHLYNPWALLNGRVGLDIAPAGLQSYFNPTLDIPYFLMVKNFLPWVTAAIMGLVHGLNFLLLLALARHVVIDTKYPRANAIFLALAGCTSAVFLSELGNTMGDNSTALFVLGGLVLVLNTWDRIQSYSRDSVLMMGIAGMLIGAAVGLKLTNATYALGSFIALLLTLPLTRKGKFIFSILFVTSVALGFAVTSGYWYLNLWQIYGNPLLPQFNNVFHSPMASSVGIVDTRWLPKSIVEAFLFPFIFLFKPARLGEVGLRQAIFPLLYLLFIAYGGKLALARWKGRLKPASFPVTHSSKAHFILIFIGLSYLIWLAVFSIHRYLAALELVTPLGLWLLFHVLFVARRADKIAIKFMIVASAVSVIGWHTWGYASFREQAFDVPPPPIANPGHSTIVLLPSLAPMAWMMPFFPSGPVVASLGQWPETPAYLQQVKKYIGNTKDNSYAIFNAETDGRVKALQRIDKKLMSWNVTSSGSICAALRWIAKQNTHYDAVITPSTPGMRCAIHAIPDAKLVSKNEENIREKQLFAFQHYGIRIDPKTCSMQVPMLGDTEKPYHICRITGVE
jgi:hypothetical protein